MLNGLKSANFSHTQINSREEHHMPTLNWIGREAVINHHNEIPYRLLRCDGELSVGDAGNGNLLVEGDSLEALKALLPYYAGQVKCIYIDPPYNTGHEDWVYSDSVDSPHWPCGQLHSNNKRMWATRLAAMKEMAK
jgi:16S rRNA G966 N2-methylase RsmD